MSCLYLGDCLNILCTLPENSVDSIVTDPPYGLSFMGKKWDYDVPSMEIWKECLRVLKPGGHLLAFGGTRTYHRLVVAIEDAGFEIRDQIQWIYGQGFPKSQDISKAIDKAAGAEREVIGKNLNARQSADADLYGINGGKSFDITAPATPEAQKWSGWGTALKPANEPICLARKPLSESTIAKNVLKHGTGGLNIDGTRIGFASEADKALFADNSNGINRQKTTKAMFDNSKILGNHNVDDQRMELGRFPSNVILDEAAAEVLDRQSGISKPKEARTGKRGGVNPAFMSKEKGDNTHQETEGFWPADPGGGASRFFYVAKASKSERGEGNTHPTVKPIKLMEYLIKLVTPPNGVVLDPFMGSGTTGVAAAHIGHDFVGIERHHDYFKIALQRIGNRVERRACR